MRQSTREKHILFGTLQQNGQDILDKYSTTVKEHTGYDLDFDCKQRMVGPTHKYVATFYLKDELHPSPSNSIAGSTYDYFTENEIMKAHGGGVHSIIKMKSLGSIVFYLQLLLSIITGIKEVTLLNMTSDPGRATRGIYNLFEIDKRPYKRSDFVGKSIDDQIELSEGEMRFILRSDSEDIWETKWEELINKLGRSQLKKHKKKSRKKTKKKKKNKKRRTRSR